MFCQLQFCDLAWVSSLIPHAVNFKNPPLNIRGKNANYDKAVWKERTKEASKNAPKDSLTPRWPAGYVIF